MPRDVRHWAECIEKGFEVVKKKRERGTLGEHESHATAVLELLFADSNGSGYENTTKRGSLDRT